MITYDQPHTKHITAIAKKGEMQFLTGSEDRTVKLWQYSPESGFSEKFCAGRSWGEPKTVTTLYAHDTGEWFVGFGDGSVQKHYQNGQVAATHQFSKDNPIRFIYQIDERIFIGENGGVEVCGIAQWRFVPLQRMQRAVSQMERFSQDQYLISAESTMLVWGIKKKAQEVLRQRWPIFEFAAIPGTTKVATTDGRYIQICDYAAGKILEQLSGEPDLVNSLAVFDTNYVVSGNEDKTLKLWDLRQRVAAKIIFTKEAVRKVIQIYPYELISAGKHLHVHRLACL